MKKVITLVMTTVLLVSLFCVSVFAAPRDFQKDPDQLSFDQVFVNGSMIANGGDNAVAARNVDGSKGDVTSVGFYGWFGTKSGSIDKFGYQIDDGTPIYGEFTKEAEDAVIAAGGELRFIITIDVTGLKDGKEHTIRAVAKLKDGTEVKLNRIADKDRDVMIKYTAPKAADPAPADPTPADPKPTGDSAIVLALLAVSALTLVVSRKKAF